MTDLITVDVDSDKVKVFTKGNIAEFRGFANTLLVSVNGRTYPQPRLRKSLGDHEESFAEEVQRTMSRINTTMVWIYGTFPSGCRLSIWAVCFPFAVIQRDCAKLPTWSNMIFAWDQLVAYVTISHRINFLVSFQVRNQ